MSSRYFSTLNYTLANEDTALELALLPAQSDTVLTIAGSGGRVLPLLARKPRRLICVDLSPAQLFLTELRLALAREAGLDDFLTFWGYPQTQGRASPSDACALRKKWIAQLELSPPAREYLRSWLNSLHWACPLYDGRWERTFAKLSRVNQWVLGEASRGLFECRTLTEQQQFLKHQFPALRWEWVIALLGNASVFNALLYKGSFPQKNIPGSRTAFYRKRYEQILNAGIARENFFLQLTFLGRLVYPEGNPIECDAQVFAKAKEALASTEVKFELGDAVSVAARQNQSVSFMSFSDVPSYFAGELEQSFLQKIRTGLAPGAKVVVRNYLRIPEGCDQSGYVNLTPQFKAAILSEKVGVYDIDILEYQGSTEGGGLGGKSSD